MVEDDDLRENLSRLKEYRKSFKEFIISELKEILGRVYQMGGNDSEIPILSTWIKDIESGATNADKYERILNSARAILNRKNDYH